MVKVKHAIYLSVDNGAVAIRLPINPEEVSVTGAGDNEKSKVHKLGAVVIPKDADALEFKMESFFPKFSYGYHVAEFQKPSYYVKLIESWKEKKKVVRFIYSGGAFPVNKETVINQFDYNEQFGIEDVNFTLELIQWRDFSPKTMTIKKPPKKKAKTKTAAKPKVVRKKAPARASKPARPTTYSLKKGENLWVVAQRYTQNGNKNYLALAKLNNIHESQYRRLPIGLKLKIPKEWTQPK